MKVAVLGTGLMGAPMARRLAVVHEVTVWNRSIERAEGLSDGCTIAQSPVAAVVDAECVIAMLVDSLATRAVLTENMLAAATDKAIIINMGSVDPQTDRDLAKLAASWNRSYLDAPVSGGVTGAVDGALAILVGGNRDTFDRAAPVFACLGRPTLLGPIGAGQVAKLANQLIVATTIGAVAEAMHLAEAGGCDAAAWRNALMGGFADSRILDLHGARMVAGDFTPGGRSAAQLKDLNNAMVLANDMGLDLPLSQTITFGFRDFVENHEGGEKDHAAYYEWLSLRS